MQERGPTIPERVAALLKRSDFSLTALLGEQSHEPIPQVALFGWAGAGTSSALRGLRVALEPKGFFGCSGGDFQRLKLAQKSSRRVEDLTAEEAQNPANLADDACDRWLITQTLEHQKVVMEARLAHCWMPPGALRIFLHCPLEIRAQRLQERLSRENPPIILSPRDAGQKTSDRDDADRNRLEKLYPSCIWLPKHFGAENTIDTSVHGEAAVVKIILARLERHCPGSVA